MRMRKILVYILLLAFIASLVGCSQATPPPITQNTQVTVAEQTPEVMEPEQSSERTVTDLLGRTVTIPYNVESTVAIGVGALRLYVYAGPLDMLVGVEQVEHDAAVGRPYTVINAELFASLPVIGLGGPNNAADPERLLNAAPDVIFTTYSTEASDADQLQQSIGIPVIALSYGSSFWDEEVRRSLELIGEVMGSVEKAQAASDFIASSFEDLQNRTRDIQDRPSVYVGALGFRGAQGIESTQGRFAPFVALNAINVADETGQAGPFMIDKEMLIEWAPDFIFLDLNNLNLVLEDYRTNPAFYHSLAAVQNDTVYGILPYNFLTTNIDTAIAVTYFIGTIIYPEAFADIDPVQKADEIYRALLGQEFYQQMVADFGGFRRIAIGN